MMAVSLAFAAMGNVDIEQIRVFSEVLPGLGLAMAGLGLMAPLMILGSFALGAMSLALVPLALMGPGLSLAVTALMGMAQALREVGSALGDIDGSKLDKLEDFAITSAVTGAASGVMAAIASPIAALGGMLGGGDEGDDAQMQIVEKLDQLIAIVEKGGDVLLDGAKVGKNLAIASSKMG